MPNRRAHLVLGAAAGTAVAVMDDRAPSTAADGLAFRVGAAVGGALGGLLPDVFDPPICPHHRGLGASVCGGVPGVPLARGASRSGRSGARSVR